MKDNNKYTTNRNNRPSLKTCRECGAYGQPNQVCKYWAYNNITKWACCHPRTKKD